MTILEGSFTGIHCDTGILQIKGGTYNSTTNETHLTTNSIDVSRSGHTLNGLLQDGYAFRKLKEDGTSGDWITDEEVLNGTTFAYGVRAEKKPDAPSVVPSETMEVAHSVKAVRDVSLPEAWEWSTESKDIALSAGVAAEAVAIYNGTDKKIYPEEHVVSQSILRIVFIPMQTEMAGVMLVNAVSILTALAQSLPVIP